MESGSERALPLLCVITPEGTCAISEGGPTFDFNSVGSTVEDACKGHFEVVKISSDSVAKLFSKHPEKDIQAMLLHADCLLFDTTIPPPMALAYNIGLRNPITNADTHTMATKECPIPYKMFCELFHAQIESVKRLYEKWAPCMVLPPEEEGGEFTIANVTTVDSDVWKVPASELHRLYDLVDGAVVQEGTDAEHLEIILSPFFSGHEATVAIQKDLNWENLKVRLEMERRQGSEHLWQVASPKGLLVGVELTHAILDKVSDSNTELSFAWDLATATQEDVYYREEVWGGQGRQQFQLGDWVVGDVESDAYLGEGQIVWKLHEDEDVKITRTLQPSVFSRTYRTHDTKVPGMSLQHSSSIMDFDHPEHPSNHSLASPERKKLRVPEEGKPVTKARRQIICTYGSNPDMQVRDSMHSLSTFATQIIRYPITEGALTQDQAALIHSELRGLNEVSLLMDGRNANREILKGRIQQAVKTPGGQARDQLKLLESKIRKMGDSNMDRELVLELIRGYKTCKSWGDVIELAEWCCDPSEIGLGDCRVDICIEWAFSMRSLSKKTSSVEDKVEFLENSAELLNKCVTLVPDDETFGALGATHKMLQALYTQSGDDKAARMHFLYSLEKYSLGFQAAPEKYYCGINYATLLEKEKSYNKENPKELEVVTRRFVQAVPKICVALGKVDALHPRSWDDYWDLATAIELAALSNQWEMGISAMRVLRPLTDHPDAKWSLESTFKQQRDLLQTLKEDDFTMTPETTLFEWWVEFYCQVFREDMTRNWDTWLFQVIEYESKNPMNFRLNRGTNSLILERDIHNPAKSKVSFSALRVGSTQNLQRDEQALTITFQDENPMTIVFVHKDERMQFANAVAQLKADVDDAGVVKKQDITVEDVKDVVCQVKFDPAEVGKKGRGNKKKLGEGCFGVVWQATNLIDGQQIAIKEVSEKLIVNMGRAANGDFKLDEIVKEVNTMCKFQHENIVQYLGCQKGPRPTQFFIFLENMPGGSLEGYLKRVGCPPRELLRSYTRQMCSALKYLHRNEVLHRDVKAGNVLLDHTLKVVKLADFGTSITDFGEQFGDEGTAGFGGKNGSINGFTAAFCPPEVINGKWAINMDTMDHLTVDVWALGCVVLQMVSATPGNLYESAWDIAPEHMPNHEESDENVCSNFHEQGSQPCWVCALQQGMAPKVPDDETPDLQAFLRLCFNPAPETRATADRLSDTPFLVGPQGVFINDDVGETLDNPGFSYSEQGELQCDGRSVRSLCDQLAIQGHVDRRPFVVSSAAKVQENVRRIKENLGECCLCFPLNAKHTGKLLDVLRRCRGISAQIEESRNLYSIMASKLPMAECIVNGCSHHSDSKLRAFIDGGMIFRMYSAPDLQILRDALVDDNGTLLSSTLKRVKVMLPSEALPPPRAACGNQTLDSLLEQLQSGASGALGQIFDPVGIHCRPGEDLDEAADLIKAELDRIKAVSDNRVFSVFVSGLDGRTAQARKFVDALAATPAKVYVKIAEEILDEASILVDRLLHISPDGRQITLQQGVADSPKTQLLPFEKQVDDGHPTPITLVSYKRNVATEVLQSSNSTALMTAAFSSSPGEVVDDEISRTHSGRAIVTSGSQAMVHRVGVMPLSVWSDDSFAHGEFFPQTKVRQFIAEVTHDGRYHVEKASHVEDDAKKKMKSSLS